jgi:DNA mismatch repair protein MutH
VYIVAKPSKVKFVTKQGEWVEETCHDISTCREHKNALDFTNSILNGKSSILGDFLGESPEVVIPGTAISVEEYTSNIHPTITSSVATNLTNDTSNGASDNTLNKSSKKPLVDVTKLTLEEALKLAEETVGKTFEEINIHDTFAGTKSGKASSNKGLLGNIFQHNVYGLEPDSYAEADIPHLGLEIKVVPVRKKLNGTWVMKERAVGNIIPFLTEDLTGDFKASSFYKKSKKTLFIFQEVLDKKNPLKNKVHKVLLHEIDSSEFYSQLEADYKVINEKIKNGLAHKLSGRDTKYLEACTKGQGNGKDLREQPSSSTLAKQRAYALKPRYMNNFLN